MKNKNLIVGAGFCGATLANLLANNNEEVILIDKKEHIAGNCYDYKDKNGITIHKYGSHIFHTNNEKIWKFLNKFSDFNTYKHKVIAKIDNNTKLNLPYNLNSLYKTFDTNIATKLEKKLISRFRLDSKISIKDLLKEKDEDFLVFANCVYEKIYSNYTKKHWGKNTILHEDFFKRVPIVLNKNEYYFDDSFQGIPKNGYTKLIENMLNHQNIQIYLKTNFNKYKDNLNKFKRIFYTGSIDELFDYKYGILPYRSVYFEIETKEQHFFQENSVINFPNQEQYTRIHEYKYYLNETSNKTTIAKEFPTEHMPGINDAHYPINNKENNKLYEKYLNECKKIPNLFILGRLGDYKYYNMDEVIIRAFEIFESLN